MKRFNNFIFFLIMLTTGCENFGQTNFQKDEFETSSGKLVIYFIGHSSLLFESNKKFIYIDPCQEFGDYSNLPKADLILITHHHHDHLDTSAINHIQKKETQIIGTSTVCDQIKEGIMMKNGDKKTVEGIEIEAVPAYNFAPGHENFHPKGGRDNGYVLTIGKKRIYIAGDTENIPEMSNLKNIDIAFLPMNQPYTMLPEQVAEAAGRINPKILYPYHFGETKTSTLVDLLKSNKNIEVRIRELK
jgi:L-ascorbate metabolism protein UlaG (beta-lactamase superfamily)